MVLISNEQYMLWSQKVCRKCIFEGSGDPNLLTLPVKKTQSLEKKSAVDKSAWIKAWCSIIDRRL